MAHGSPNGQSTKLGKRGRDGLGAQGVGNPKDIKWVGVGVGVGVHWPLGEARATFSCCWDLVHLPFCLAPPIGTK